MNISKNLKIKEMPYYLITCKKCGAYWTVNKMDETKFDAKTLAAIAVMAALTTVATILITVPFPATGGYFNLGDTIVVTTSLIFGPIVGAIAGGVGSGLADFMGGWMAFIIPTTVIKGLEGFVVGYIAGKREDRTIMRLVIA